MRARIGILSRANHMTSALRIGEQSESPKNRVAVLVNQKIKLVWPNSSVSVPHTWNVDVSEPHTRNVNVSEPH